MKATKLPSGNYRCRVEIGRDESGKRIWKSITGPTKKAVEAEAARFALTSIKGDGKTFDAHAEKYIRMHRAVLSPATVRVYTQINKYLKEREPWLYNMPIHGISTQDLQRVVDDLVCYGLKSHTVSNYYHFICSVLDDAEITLRRPKLPQKERPNLNIPDDETVTQVIEIVKGTDLEIPVLLAAFGPLRRGEICALTLDDIDGNVIHVSKDKVKDANGNWVIKPPKTYSSDRYLEMPPHIIELIRKQGYVCKLDPNHLSKKFGRMLRQNHIKPFRFHDLRHFCCSYLHAQNVPDRYIMQRTGHASVATLQQIYTHTLQNQSKIETQRILESFDRVTSRVTSE